MKLGVIIQARVNSTRLPKKILLEFYKEKTILDVLITKLKLLKNYPIILATSDNVADLVLENVANKHAIKIFYGSEQNVLDRFIRAGQKFNLDAIIRICSDNPFLDFESIKKLIYCYEKMDNLDYCSFVNYFRIPAIKTHLGLFAEIVSLKALKKTKSLTSEQKYVEHVTNYIYEHPDLFNIHLEPMPVEVYKRRDLRFTLDDRNDFDRLKRIYQLYIEENLSIIQLIDFVDSDIKLLEGMNKNIKKYTK